MSGTGSAMFPYWLGQYSANPKLQYGLLTGGTGANNSKTVTLPTGYSDTNYSVLVTHQGTTAGANVAVNILSTTSFTIYWSNAGAGTQQFFWMTIGTV